jgi:hypothetical protein
MFATLRSVRKMTWPDAYVVGAAGDHQAVLVGAGEVVVVIVGLELGDGRTRAHARRAAAVAVYVVGQLLALAGGNLDLAAGDRRGVWRGAYFTGNSVWDTISSTVYTQSGSNRGLSTLGETLLLA